MVRIAVGLRLTLFSMVKYGIDLRTYDSIANQYGILCKKSTMDRSRYDGCSGNDNRAIGGSAWESKRCRSLQHTENISYISIYLRSVVVL
jgi:hypothetical protein